MPSMTEQEFKKLCQEVYADRHQVYAFVPTLARQDALRWMLLGCLVALLSVLGEEQPRIDESSADPYGEAIVRIVAAHAGAAFDPQPHLAELDGRLEAEARSDNLKR